MARRSILKRFLVHRATMAATNVLVVASVALLFVLRLAQLPEAVRQVLELIDFGVLIVFTIDFLLRLFTFGRAYFFRDFGWVDFLSVIPLLGPLMVQMGQFRALRIARLIRLVRIIRVVRLLRSYDGSDAEHLQMKARFFLAVSSTSMMFLLATAVLITGLVNRSLEQVAGVNVEALLNRIELVIMSTAVLAAVGITATANVFLKRLVTGRVQEVNDYIESVLTGGNKLPMRPDELGDEITDLKTKVSRVTNLFVT